MKEKAKRLWNSVKEFTAANGNDHTSAYAAMSAFFFVLSFIPIILLLMTMIQYTTLTKVDIIDALRRVVPDSITPTVLVIVNQVYNQSAAVIPVTIIVAMWSAGRGVLAVTYGLNWIYKSRETRNYFYLRFRATFYTILFLVVIIMTLLVLGFGNSISALVERHIPFATHITKFMLEIRLIVAFAALILFSLCIYTFLPNKKNSFLKQLPGAIFTAAGWILTSFFVSKYMEIFKGFENMYGSLTTIILIMLWLYFSMYILLLGGKLNVHFLKKKEEEQGGN